MGRPRKLGPDWLPKYCYVDHGRIVYKKPGKPAIRVCSVQASREKFEEMLPLAIRQQEKGRILSKTQIRASAIPLTRRCGVYFLLKDEEIVYVGKSTNLESRLVNHTFTKINEFDSYYAVEAHPDYLDEIEQQYIKRFKPRLNRLHIEPARRRKTLNP